MMWSSFITFVITTMMTILLVVSFSSSSSLSSVSLLLFVNAQCKDDTQIQFKLPAAQSGTPSYISQPYGQGGTVYYERPVGNFRALPPIIIQSVDSKERNLEFTKDGSLVVCTANPPLRMGGSSVEMNRGQALFDSLTILEELRTGVGEYTLNFTMTDKNSGRVFTIQSPPLEMVVRNEQPVSMRLRSTGFLLHPNPAPQIPVNVSLPPWWIEFVGRTGYPVPATQGTTRYTVRIVPRLGKIVPDKQYDGAESIEFSNVVYYPPPVGSPEYTTVSTLGVKFDFISDLGLVYGTANISTGTMPIVEEIERNRFMQFDPLTSYIRYDNEGGTAVLGVRMPPIVIKLYTSQMGFDASNTGFVILATSAQAKLSGSEALVIRGVATFSVLTFEEFAPRTAVITFTLSRGSKGSPLQLYSGSIYVTESAIKASRLKFEPTSEISEQDSPYAVPAAPTVTPNVFKFTLPTVRVGFVDSADRYDLTADKIDLELQIDPPTFTFDSTGTNRKIVRADYGTATWDKLAVTANIPSNSTFSVRVNDPSGIRSTLVSSKVTILDNTLSVASSLSGCISDNTYCPLKLKFMSGYGSRRSAVYDEDVSVFTTAGSTMPTIVLSLNDWFGPLYKQDRTIDIDSKTFSVKAYTSDPNNEQVLDVSGVYGRYQDGLFFFECLRISEATGLVRINFLAETSSGLVFEGLGRPRTGFTTVLSSPISGYAVRFASYSLLQYHGQSTSAVVGVALPPITLEVLDSQNQYDSADTSVTVTAQTSTPNEPSITVTAQKGLITFPLIQFLAASENPTVTFSVTSSNNPVGGQTLTTGPIRLTTLVIPLYEIAFDNGRQTQSRITSQFQTINDLPSWGEIRSVLIIRDSAHETAQSLESEYIQGTGTNPIQVEVYSEDADIGTPVASTFLTTCANRDYPCVDIRTTIRGVKPNVGVPAGGPVYLKYRVKSGPAILVGQELVAGPLSLAGTGASCGGAGGGASAVVAEFKQPIKEFQAQVASIGSEIATSLGVEPARVNIATDTAKQVVRTGFLNLETLDVTKVRISFLDPLATSTIRKSRADLQSEFLQVRPQCDLPALNLHAVYGVLQEKDCDPQKFIDGIQEAKTCTRNGNKPMCECYENGVVRDQGDVCANDPSLQSDLVLMCMEIRSSCQDSGIQNLCSNILVPNKSSMVWAWATLGAIAAVAIGGYAYYKRRQALQRETIVLGGG